MKIDANKINQINNPYQNNKVHSRENEEQKQKIQNEQHEKKDNNKITDNKNTIGSLINTTA